MILTFRERKQKPRPMRLRNVLQIFDYRVAASSDFTLQSLAVDHGKLDEDFNILYLLRTRQNSALKTAVLIVRYVIKR